MAYNAVELMAALANLAPVGRHGVSCSRLLTVKIRQPSHEFTFGVVMTFVSYSLVLTPVV
jgi:hypothetical protein